MKALSERDPLSTDWQEGQKLVTLPNGSVKAGALENRKMRSCPAQFSARSRGVAAGVVVLLIGVSAFTGSILDQDYVQSKFQGIPLSATPDDVRKHLGDLFSERECSLDDIPDAWRNRDLEKTTSSVREYCHLFVFDFYVLFDDQNRSYLAIPNFE